jgi:hypothetical protein
MRNQAFIAGPEGRYVALSASIEHILNTAFVPRSRLLGEIADREIISAGFKPG